MTLEIDRRFHHIFRSDHPTNSPTRHGIRLGHTIHDHAAIGNLRHECGHRGERVIAVHEMLIDLVRHHPNVIGGCPLPNRNRLFGRIHGPTRVVRRNEKQHLGARCARSLELFDGDLEFGLFSGVHHYRHTTRQRNGLGVCRPIRGGHDHFVTGITQRGKGNEYRMFAPIGDEHLGCLA